MTQRLHNVIFVLGGPGSGKGTQCELLCAQRNLRHLSIGDILRTEQQKPSSAWASIIEVNIRNGLIGSKEMTVGLLKDAMLHHTENQPSTLGFVIDGKLFQSVRPQLIDHALGFPRTLDRAEYFEQTIEPPLAVLVLDCPEDVMKERLKARADVLGRVDDNESIITMRLDIFAHKTKQVIDYYDQRNILSRVNGLGLKDEVNLRVLAAVDKVLAR